MSPLSHDRILAPRFVHEGGWCWRCPVPGLRSGDSGDAVDRSRLVLLEDGQPVGSPHALHAQIRMQGGGLYSHWLDSVWFSTSDNSDPNTNGRTYTARWDLDTYLQQRSRRKLPAILDLLGRLPGGAAGLSGRTVMEIGPGAYLDTVLTLAGLGAEVVAVDRQPGPWNPDWHQPYLRGLGVSLRQSELATDDAVLARIAAATSYEAAGIIWTGTLAESLPEDLTDRIHMHCSHATLEHLNAPDLAFLQLARVSRSGTMGVHLVDFCDHRDSTRPLEFLLLDDGAYDRENQEYHYIWGNRVLPSVMAQCWLAAGFDILSFDVIKTVEPEYLDDFLPRLRCSSSRFRAAEQDDLSCAQGIFVVQKRG
ncbi:hypothetical protein [Magnetospirillum sp. SS-4]|uniref:hypothetical protein n=1 Tax=Magnetospirillum sp. SS-4 TaxID=2681465 RepID=UPI001380CF4B|nr:hypothetical protein [Magnetospirillum sp. SS-4]CAA7619659.1 hypothetical protein MTBSS4_250041 [Magnetospirillum sp. SS-4]